MVLSAKFDCPVAHQDISFLDTVHDCETGLDEAERMNGSSSGRSNCLIQIRQCPDQNITFHHQVQGSYRRAFEHIFPWILG